MKKQKSNYLQFGFDGLDAALDLGGTVEYLKQFGFDKNPLMQAREGAGDARRLEENYNPDKEGARFCDFCAAEITGVSYRVLESGLERCTQCSASAIQTEEEFRKLYKSVLRNMETFFNISLHTAVRVRMTDAKKIARLTRTPQEFTPGFDPRVLGFARKDRDGFSLYIESGSPKLAAVATMAHELTHIWQYLNWNDAKLAQTYGANNLLLLYEGMAKWVEIQYLYLIHETAYAKRQEIITRRRQDEYGVGFVLFEKEYMLTQKAFEKSRSPFSDIQRPL